MKLFAARAEIDADDIILLYRQLGFTTADEGLDLVEQAYPRRCGSSSPKSWIRCSSSGQAAPRIPAQGYPLGDQFSQLTGAMAVRV
jgi:hypothetical protein